MDSFRERFAPRAACYLPVGGGHRPLSTWTGGPITCNRAFGGSGNAIPFGMGTAPVNNGGSLSVGPGGIFPSATRPDSATKGNRATAALSVEPGQCPSGIVAAPPTNGGASASSAFDPPCPDAAAESGRAAPGALRTAWTIGGSAAGANGKSEPIAATTATETLRGR